MNNVLNKFRKRNIQTNITEFLLVIFVFALSICLLSGLFINYLTLKKSSENFLKNSNLQSYIINTNGVSQADEDFFKSKFNYSKRYVFDTDFNEGGRNYAAKVLVSNGKISIPYIVDGEKGEGCYVDKRFIDKYNIGVNNSRLFINVSLGGEEKRVEFKVVGAMTMAENLTNDEKCVIFIDEKVFLDTLKLCFVGIEDADLSVINYNQILVKTDNYETAEAEIKSYFNNSSTTLANIEKIDENASIIALKKEIKKAKQMLYTFPIIFVLVSILVIVSSLSQLVLKERYNIGLLKALGISNKELVLNYAGYGGNIGFLGAIFGMIISPLIIPNITFEVYDKMFYLPRDEVKLFCPVWFVVLVVIISVIVGYLTSMFVSLRLVEKYPKDCLGSARKINLKTRKSKTKVPITISSAARNLRINLSRTIMTIVGFSGSSLLCLIGFGVSELADEDFSGFGLKMFKTYSKIFQIFSIILLILTIVILIVQIFRERYKDMALMRVHGEAYEKIWFSVVFEMVILGLIGYVISCALCQIVFGLMLKLFDISGLIFINFTAYLKTFLIIFGLILVISSFGLIKIYKINLGKAIKFSE